MRRFRARVQPKRSFESLFLLPHMPDANHRDIDLLLFDLDGTLIDTRRDLAEAVNYALQQLGKAPLSLEGVIKLVGDGVHTLLARVLAEEAERVQAQALAWFRQYYGEHLADHSRLYSGMRETLEHFQDTPKAVLSNKPEEFTRALLRQLGVQSFFQAIVGARPDLPLKPHPQALQGILQKLSVPSGRAVMIGDGENDILAGKAAGVLTCAVTYGFRPQETLLSLRPDFVAHTPQDLMALRSPTLASTLRCAP